jgi:hypothetical protein
MGWQGSPTATLICFISSFPRWKPWIATNQAHKMRDMTWGRGQLFNSTINSARCWKKCKNRIENYLMCPWPCFLLMLVWGGWQYHLGFSLGAGLSMLMRWEELINWNILLAPKYNNEKMGRKHSLTFPLCTLLFLAFWVGRMKVVSPDSVWVLKHKPWQGQCIWIWLGKIKS